MFVITDKDNVIYTYFENLGYLTNGYPKNQDTNVAYANASAHEVDEIPEGVIGGKYCYSPGAGFYENPNWKEPNKYGIPDDLLQQIQDDTVADLIELGVI